MGVVRVDCRTSESDRLETEKRPAGRVALHLAGFDPAASTSWSIDGTGPDLRPHFLAWRGLPPALEELYVPTELPRDATVWLRQEVPPGDYTLEFLQGGAARAFRFTALGGEVTDVFVELD